MLYNLLFNATLIQLTSLVYVTTRFLTCDRFQNRSAHFKTGWPVLKREARESLKYLVIGR